MRFLLNRSLLTKLLMLLGVIMLSFAAVMAVSAGVTRARMVADRSIKLRAVAEVAASTAATLEAEVTAGHIDRAEALARFRQLLYGIRYEGNEYLFAYTNDGHVFVVGSQPKVQGDDRLQIKDHHGNFFVRDILATAQRGGGTVDYWYPRASGGEPLPKRSYVVAFAPWDMVIGTGVYVDDLDVDFGAYLRFIGLVLLGALAVGGVLALLLAREITSSMRRMRERLERLAAGDHRSPVEQTDRGDEVGAMARALEVVREGAAEANRLREEREVLKGVAEAERAAALDSLANALERSVGSLLEELQSEAADMQTAADALSQTAGAMQTRVEASAGGADQATGNVQAVAAAAEQLSCSIGEIARRVAEAARVAQDATGRVSATSAQVAELATAAGEIGRVVDLIQTIAAQTNLLALNATIEAARAGEAGRGFAVVANEVKALAAQTARATDEIRGQVERIQSATGRAVAAVDGIAEAVAAVDSISATIASAVEQQGSATREIAVSVTRAADATATVSANVGGMRRDADAVGQTAGTLLGAAGSLQGSAAAVSEEVARLLAGVRAKAAA
jgi:methyl-accepting chemotaxis protein